jgi:hypothetical protein
MKSISEIRNDVRRIAQGNVQLPLMDILDHLENMGACDCMNAHEEALDALEADKEPEVVHGPDEMQTPDVVEESEEDLELETLEVENDYVQQNLEEEETE